MASGSITLSSNSGKSLEAYISWSSSSNGTSANSSYVSATIYCRRDSYGTTTGTWSGYLNVGGTKKSFSVKKSIDQYWRELITVTATIPHNSDGVGTCSLSGEVNGPSGTSMNGVRLSGSRTVTLDRIYRRATVTSGTNFTDETNPTIYYSNPAGNAVTALEACLSYDGSVDFAYRPIPKTGSSYTYVLSEQDRAKLRGDCVNVKSRSVRLYVRTQIGSSYTDYSYVTVTASIVNAEPTIDSYWAIDTNPTTIALTGNNTTVVNGYSNLDIGMSSSAKKNAYIADNQILYADSWHKSTSGTWNGATSGQIKYWTKDSRGYEKYATKNLTFVNYFKPRCGIVLGTPTASGDMSFTIHGSYWKGNFGVKNNTLDVQYILREKGTSTASTTDTWIRVPLSDITFNGNSFSHTVYLSGLDYRKTYSVQAWMGDLLDADYSADLGFSTRPVFDWSKNDFNFNVPVKLNGKEINPIIEDYHSGDWHVIKYANGEMVQIGWFLKTIQPSEWSVWSGHPFLVINWWGDFPEPFTGVPYIFHNVAGNVFMSSASHRAPSATNPGDIYVYRPAEVPGSAVNVQGSVLATGRWK